MEAMGTVVVGAILLVIVGAIIWSMISDKKKGKSIQCELWWSLPLNSPVFAKRESDTRRMWSILEKRTDAGGI